MKSEKNPITQEAVERWQQGKINIFDEMARLEDEINSLKLRNHILEVANDELDEENKRLKEDLELYKKVNLDLRKELTMCEKLVELNMKDLWDIADQRDWYYEEYQKMKARNEELKNY